MMKEEKWLYLECLSGISGDMTVGALLDLGASKETLIRALDSLRIGGYHLHFGRKIKCGIDAYDFDVHLEDEALGQGHEHSHEHEHEHEHETDHGHGHDHEHETDHGYSHDHEHETDHSHGYDHGHGHEHEHETDHSHGYDHGHSHEHEHETDHSHGYDHGHSHDHEHETDHDHGHAHDHSHAHNHGDESKHGHSHAHPHIHRGIRDIFEIIDRLDSTQGVKEMAKKMFSIVAEAESKAHGIPAEQVHFHEVGAVDSIVDIISTAVCLNDLGIDKIVVSPLSEGRGYVRCQHGVMPVPVPATANIAAANDLELRFVDNDGEMVTPTGAAIAAAIRTEKELPKYYSIEKIGIGAGNKDFKNANILRAMIVRPKEAESCKNADGETGKEQQNFPSGLWVLETNVDDCTGEALGFVMECLLLEGARDAYYTPAFMKKNRPGYVLHVMCEEEAIKNMEAVIFAHTTTIGIRRYPVDRTELKRKIQRIETRFGCADVKVCSCGDKIYIYPEYESIKKICKEQNLDFSEVYHAVKEDALRS